MARVRRGGRRSSSSYRTAPVVPPRFHEFMEASYTRLGVSRGGYSDPMTPDDNCKMFFTIYVETFTTIGRDSASAAAYREELADCPAKYLEELERFDNSELAREAPLVKDNGRFTHLFEKKSMKEECALLSKLYKEAYPNPGENSASAINMKEYLEKKCHMLK